MKCFGYADMYSLQLFTMPANNSLFHFKYTKCENWVKLRVGRGDLQECDLHFHQEVKQNESSAATLDFWLYVRVVQLIQNKSMGFYLIKIASQICFCSIILLPSLLPSPPFLSFPPLFWSYFRPLKCRVHYCPLLSQALFSLLLKRNCCVWLLYSCNCFARPWLAPGCDACRL